MRKCSWQEFKPDWLIADLDFKPSDRIVQDLTWKNAIYDAIALDGDPDTMVATTNSLARAFYGGGLNVIQLRMPAQIRPAAARDDFERL
ncbi:hypothetical protein [Synechococcus sp. PCC 7335]|uniref:hypothetical protein n=1 Tax=Synechococcus sp. (strain ATCC 29403 / PCC 7335) TaxID=91464 RepID=UPI0002E59538|nr:hypothetical protein [Synechococcus sp. PCC 7335]